jgi:hypothetical protein
MATPEEVQLQDKLNDELKITNNTLNSIANNLAEQFKLQQKIGKEVEQTANDYYKDLAKTLKASAKDVFTIAENQESLNRGALRSSTIQTQINKSLKEQNKAAATFELLEQEIGTLTKEEAQWRNDALEASKQQVATLTAQLTRAKQIEKTAGLTGKIFEGISQIPLLGKLVDTEKILENVYQTAANTGSKWAAFGSGLTTTFSQIGKKLTDPVVLFTAQIGLIKKFFDLYGGVNKRIVEQGKQLNISKEQSQALYESAYQYAAEQRNAFVTEARILEGRYKLNEALGTSIAFTNKEAITAEKLSHYYGISEEQNAHLAVLGREIGQTNDDILNTVIKTTVNQKAQFGGTISQQKVLQKVSSVSGDILTKFKGNVSELAKAVLQADRLGLTLEQVDKIGESLLNFEQSIEAELKAELLTGKAINLEKARSAALSGDTAKLTTAIAEEVGNIHKFEKMNVLQRQAYAEAFGMSASEMGDMLRKREFENKLGADATKSAAEQLRLAKERGITVEESVRKDLEAKSLAELQKYTFEKISSILSRIAAGPMATIYKYIEKGLKGVEGILGGFSKMTGGGLGNALGAAILGAPLLLATTRLMAGGLRGLLFQRGTDANPMVTRPTLAGGMGGGMGGLFGGKTTLASGAYVQGGQAFSAAGKPLTGAAANSVITAAGKQGRGFGAFSPKSMGAGLGLGVGGMALSGIASSMEPGAGANTVGVLGQTAQYAGMGMMFGPWGAAIGGLVGLGMGLFNLSKENEERRKQEADTNKETQKKTNELIEQLSSRPVKLTINNEDLGRINTNTSMFSGNSKLATS